MPVVVQGAAGEANPSVIRPAGAQAQNTINIEGAEYLTITGLEIGGKGHDAMNMNADRPFVTLEDLEIHDIDVGVHFRSSLHSSTVRWTSHL